MIFDLTIAVKIGSLGHSQLIFFNATIMILTILNSSHGLDIFHMLVGTGPWVQNFHGQVKDQSEMSSLLSPRLQPYRSYKPSSGT